MRLPPFDVYIPKDMDDALQWLTAHKERNIKVIAGGTDLLVNLREPVIPYGHRPPPDKPCQGVWVARRNDQPRVEALLALWSLPELRGIESIEDRIRVGATCRIRELEHSPLINNSLLALAEGAAHLGTTLVRNRGTYGGNLCNARPAADTAIPTLALGGILHLVSSRGSRFIKMEEFVLGPGVTVCQKDEILKEVWFSDQWSPPRGGSSYIRLATRLSLDIAVVSAAVALRLDDRGRVEKARIALGAVGPTPILALRGMESLKGQELTPEIINRAGQESVKDARPITDFRGSVEYRRLMVEVLVRRALSLSAKRLEAKEVIRS